MKRIGEFDILCGVKPITGLDVSQKNRSARRRSLNCPLIIQANVGPTTPSGTDRSDIPPIYRSISSTCLERDLHRSIDIQADFILHINRSNSCHIERIHCINQITKRLSTRKTTKLSHRIVCQNILPMQWRGLFLDLQGNP